MSQEYDGLLVLGAGQMRTGTTTLKIALERLYGGKCYHMFEIIHKHQSHVNLWNEILDKEVLDENMSKELFHDYFGAVDNPAAAFYEDLMIIYPKSKVILTTRDPDEWVKSVRNTTIPKSSILWDYFERLSFFSYGISGINEMFRKLRLKSFRQSYEVLRCDDETLKSCFEAYNEEVRRKVPKERLLEFNLKDGWEPLCRFLDFPIPEEPFPYVNNAKEYQEIFNKIHRRFILKCGIVIVSVLGLVVFGFRRG